MKWPRLNGSRREIISLIVTEFYGSNLINKYANFYTSTLQDFVQNNTSQVILELSWKRKFTTVKSLKADVSSISPSPERLGELWVVCGFVCRKWSRAIGGKMDWLVNKNKLVEWKGLVDTVGIKSADLEDKFLFYCFAAFWIT